MELPGGHVVFLGKAATMRPMADREENNKEEKKATESTTPQPSPLKSDAAKREEKVLAFWKEHRIFEQSLEKPSPKGEFVFYEGPPTANGRPGIHHLSARSFKDAIPRYKTMRGYHVRRKAGWDTHGLPVELEVEKTLGFTSKQDIEAYGVGAFNKKCKESVWKYVDEWQRFTERIGYWVDQDDPYITYDPKYIESIWHILSQVEKRGLLYKDYKVVPWCPRCGTALSSHELAQGYQDVKDLSVYVKFKLKVESEKWKVESRKLKVETISVNLPVYILAWTTTPWTLPGNVGLAVGEDIEYVAVEILPIEESGTSGVAKYPAGIYLIANARYSEVIEKEYGGVVLGELKGADLIGLEYEPLYPFLQNTISESERPKLENAFKVYPADFVTTTDGTGVVHTAVMYGQDDFELGTAVGLPKHHLVDEGGHFTAGTGFLEGKFVRAEETAVDIIKDLAHRDLLFKKEKYEHSYPHCWRCKTALIYYARDSWYIRMSAVRDELVAENEKINWVPGHIKNGRFGEWLADVKDWAISRSRYWGTPLPIWQSADGMERIVVDSVATLKEHVKTSGNQYFVMRHGEAEGNTKNTLNADPKTPNPLTAKGWAEVESTAEKLKARQIDLIFHSPLERATKTAHTVADVLGLSAESLIVDGRLREVGFGDFEGKKMGEYHAFFANVRERFTKRPQGGETWLEVKRRMGECLYELERTHANKRILIISHNGPLQMLTAVSEGLDTKGTAIAVEDQRFSMSNAEVREVSFVPLPHNDDYELDLHRPHIDAISLESKSGVPLFRVPEVLDVWFDSGAMPFAQDHYPFENREWVEDSGYPADYISEAIDQTRGWFYTLHAIGVLLGRGMAYKNVICLGHLLDKDGKKMSKSVGNVVDPWAATERFGADALRLWMYSVNQPGDAKNFDERTVDELRKKVFNLLDNIVRFYELYVEDGVATEDAVSVEDGVATENSISTNESSRAQSIGHHSTHVLDEWIMARLHSLIRTATEQMDEFNLLDPTRGIRDFIADFSQWYIRRSRDRFKGENKTDKSNALATTRYVLHELSKVMAPFVPFFAEEIYQKVRTMEDPPSVHLADWPVDTVIPSLAESERILNTMTEVRSIVSRALEMRATANIKVRQPLASLRILNAQLQQTEKSQELLQLIRDEINVKEVLFDESIESSVMLDIEVTPQLKREGQVRELVRAIQELRKKAGLQSGKPATLEVATSPAGRAFVELEKESLYRQAGIAQIVFLDEITADMLEFEDFSLRARLV